MTILDELAHILRERKSDDPANSYVASLYQAGTNKILEKVGEALVKEVADLWFHSMVLLEHLDLTHEAVLIELESRLGVSGHAEKASRTDS